MVQRKHAAIFAGLPDIDHRGHGRLRITGAVVAWYVVVSLLLHGVWPWANFSRTADYAGGCGLPEEGGGWLRPGPAPAGS